MWAICFCVSVLLFDLMFHLGKHGIAWPWPKALENKTHLLYAGGMLAASQYNIYIYIPATKLKTVAHILIFSD